MTAPRPELCLPNFLDINNNSQVVITLSTSQGSWYDEASKLYDHRSDSKLYTSNCADDTKTATIDIDLGDQEWLDTIKMLSTNAKAFIWYHSDDAISYTTFITSTVLAASYYSWFASSTTTDAIVSTAVLDSNLGHLIFAGGTEHRLLKRYLRLVITSTQTANDEKYLGELYVGRRVIKLSSVRRYKQTLEDKKESSITGYRGIVTTTQGYPVFRAEMTIYRPTLIDWNLIKTIITARGILEFFPAGTESTTSISRELDGNEVVLVESVGTWYPTVWGPDVNGQIDLNLQETEFVY